MKKVTAGKLLSILPMIAGKLLLYVLVVEVSSKIERKAVLFFVFCGSRKDENVIIAETLTRKIEKRNN